MGFVFVLFFPKQLQLQQNASYHFDRFQILSILQLFLINMLFNLANSVACLAALQRHGECLALVNKRLEEETDSPDLFIMRARLHELFRNVSVVVQC